jgi:hypothetical protein
MKLVELIYPNQKVNRSINLERDKGQKDAIENYQITGKGIEILRRFLSAINGEAISAWSLTGPYGMGKSAFINFLLALTSHKFSPVKEIALKKLADFDCNLEKEFKEATNKISYGNGFINIPVTASYEPINNSVAKGIINALSNNGFNNNETSLLKKALPFKHLLDNNNPDTNLVIKCLSTLRNKYKRPVLLAIDELGKNLEFMAHYPEKGDIFILQLLAETTGIYLWVCLHQSFEGYATGLNNQQKKEWNKIQGRFEDISFIETTAQMLSLTKRVIVHEPTLKNYTNLYEWAVSFIKLAKKEKIPYLENMTKKEVLALYPFHPTAAIVLPELCRRFAQNDRTLFSFLGSGDPHALPEFLGKYSIEKNSLPFLGIDYLYDYFFSVSTSAFINRPEAQRWIEIQSLIEQSHVLSNKKQAILKTIGILNLISSQFSLPASHHVLRSICKDVLKMDEDEFNKQIDDLKKTIIFYREYAKEFRLWEGSDFDIGKAIENKKAKLEMNQLESVLQKYYPLSDKIAARHSYQTGTIRRFECKWIDITKIIEGNIPSLSEGYDGMLLYTFGDNRQLKNIPKVCKNGQPLIILYCMHKNQIKEITLEAAAIKNILNEAPELVNDGVARKEVKYRSYIADDYVRRYVDKIYSPGSGDLQCYIGSSVVELKTYKDLSFQLSKLCDNFYNKCPVIKNEMINYNKLSSAAARARRELAEAMVEKEKEEQLGLKGFGPEVALYRTLLRLNGLHYNDNGEGYFVKPVKTNANFLSLWNFIDDILFNSNNNSNSDLVNIQMIIEKIKMPPFGMREGPILIFLLHYLIVNNDNIALFQEGEYKPYFGEAEVSLLIKRPEFFSLKRFDTTPIQREIIRAYFNVLNSKEIQMNDSLRNTSLLKIVSPLLKFIDNLPRYTRLTRQISLSSQKLRSILLNSREPVNLIFKDIPEALGMKAIDLEKKDGNWEKEFSRLLESALSELDSAYDKLNNKIQKNIMKAFGWEPNLDNFHKFRQEIQRQFLPVYSSNVSNELKSTIGALVNKNNNDEEWTRAIAGLIAKKPVVSWSDSEFDPFMINLFENANRIQSVRKLVLASGVGHDNNSVVISFTVPDGKIVRKLIHLDADTCDFVKKEFSNILNQPENIRETLLNLLLLELLKENKS